MEETKATATTSMFRMEHTVRRVIHESAGPIRALLAGAAEMGVVTPELRYLVFTALLTGTLWVPVVIGYVRTRGVLRLQDYRVAPTSPLPHWVNRANRAHLNAVESFAPFAAVVLVATALHVSTPVTALAAAVFFWARLLHAIVHVSGVGLLRARTLIFSLGWMAFVTFAVETLRQA